MLVLGLNGNFGDAHEDLVPGMADYYFHDASACLIRNGELIAAVEEERLNRIKKTTKFPVNAIRECLRVAGVTPAEVAAVGYYFAEEFTDHALNSWYLENREVPLAYSRQLIKDKLKRELNWYLPDNRLFYTPHHDAHALSSFHRSGMDEALVIVLDARGEEHSGTVYRANGTELETLATYDISKSLGTLYEAACNVIGYRFGDEYKVMGLAPYGNPATYRELFDSLYQLHDNGDYALNPAAPEMSMVGPTFFAAGFQARRKGEPLTQEHKDFAAGLQELLEKVVLHVVSHWAKQTGLKRLCFTGGVAHNSSLNGVLARSGLFDEMFIHPSAHDAGAAEGAALSAARSLNPAIPKQPRLRSASLGPGLGDTGQIKETLDAWSPLIEFDHPADIVQSTAELLAAGSVLGWAHGRSEFGPRALGNRSIIADPRPKENQDKINLMVKKRESFRPFAPVVTAEDADRFFEFPAETTANYDFMSYVMYVREQHRDDLGAVTHVDGTARIQVVERESNERFHRLVARFGELTGTPVLLNTSFNNNAEPIVQTVEDVLTCFLTTDIDYLVIEDFLVRRKPDSQLALDDFVPAFRPVTKVARRQLLTPDGRYETQHEVYLDYSTGPRAEISAETHAILAAADGLTPLAELAELTGHELTDEVRAELHDLWQRRFFTLTPKAG